LETWVKIAAKRMPRGAGTFHHRADGCPDLIALYLHDMGSIEVLTIGAHRTDGELVIYGHAKSGRGVHFG